jgi:hypothetical protein
MVFRSRRDRFFRNFILIGIVIVLLAYILPLFLDSQVTTSDTIVVLLLMVVTVGFLVWVSFSIQYVFREKYLVVRAGPLWRRIPYEEITKVAPTKDIFTGFRMLSARDALEVSYKTALFGGVKISPLDHEGFIKELKRRCPDVRVADY